MPEYTYKIRVNDSRYVFKYWEFLYADGKEVDNEFLFTASGAKSWVKRAKRRHEKRRPRILEEGKL